MRSAAARPRAADTESFLLPLPLAPSRLSGKADYGVPVDAVERENAEQRDDSPESDPGRSGTASRHQRAEEMIQDPAFESERGKPEVPEHRHFEDLPVSEERDGIDPLRSGPVVPELPHHTAQHAADQQAPEAAAPAGGKRHREARDPEPFQNRVEQEDRPDPNGGEEEPRPQEGR